MNQILYEQKEKRRGNTIEINKIVLFFSIAVIVFGLIMLGEGVYGYYKNSEMRAIIENTTPTVGLDREGQQLKISISHIRGLQSVTYNWNNDEDTAMEIDVTGKQSIIQRIELPAGENEFNITAIDINGKTTNISKEFYMETGRDITKPEINVSYSGSKLKITATDEQALSYLTYRWNEDEETRVEPNEENNGIIELDVGILRGKNTITIIAVDSSNNTSSKEATFEGRTVPKVQAWYDGVNLNILATHEVGVEKVEYTLNGQTHTVDSPQGPEMLVLIPLEPGYNRITVVAYSAEDTQTTFEGDLTI